MPIATSHPGLFENRLRLVRLGVLGIFGLLAVTWITRPWVAGDTPFVWDGTDALIGCLKQGDFVACRHSSHLDYWGLTSPIGDWPLLQHIPDLITVGLGGNAHHTRELVFVFLGVAGVVGSVVLARITLARIGQAAWFWGFLFVLLSGPMIVYARMTVGEALATGLLVFLVAATVLPMHPALVGLAVLAASLTKETSYPFVAALAVLGLLLARRRLAVPIRRYLSWGATGLVTAVVLASLFNVVRFGSVVNTNYLEPELRTPWSARIVEYSLALLVSPNGGIAFYWPVAVALLAAACLLPLGLWSGAHLDLAPALVLLGVMVALTLGFASWWDIFGSLYGPRLILPWVLPLVLMALVAYGSALGDLTLRLLLPTWRLLLIFGLVLVFTLPHVGQLWKPDALAGFARGSTPCEAPWRGGVSEWHACQSGLLWFDHRPRPTFSIEGVATMGGAVTTLGVAFALLGCLVLLREDLRSTADHRQG